MHARFDLPAAFVAVALAACAARNAPLAATGAPVPAGNEPSVASATPPLQPDAGAAPASANKLTLYRRGTFVERDAATATSSDGCLGTPADVASCRARSSAGQEPCELEQPVNAGDVHCSGAVKGPMIAEIPTPPPACACTCDPVYAKARKAFYERLRACSNVP